MRTISGCLIGLFVSACTRQVSFTATPMSTESQIAPEDTRFRICRLEDDGDDLHKQLRAAVCGDPARPMPANARAAEYDRVAELIGTLAMPPGSVIAYAGTGTPLGWLDCDGSAVTKARYPRLFAAIGTTYGNGGGQPGDFSLPNYQGRFLRGVSGTSNVDPDAATRTAPWAGGKPGNVVGSEQPDALQSHTHSYVFGHGGGPDGDVPHRRQPDGQKTIASSGPENANVSGETRPRNVAVRWLIRY